MKASNPLIRQWFHWMAAIERLSIFENLSSASNWSTLERYLRFPIKSKLGKTVQDLKAEANSIKTLLNNDTPEAREKILDLRKNYLRVETVIDFFADAINTRVNDYMMSYLSSCDLLARLSMDNVLRPLKKEAPPVLTYVDKGLGASILKHGLRLWDGTTENPVAAIKIVRHNMARPTSLIHEAGHQVAHILGWNDELRSALKKAIPGQAGMIWGSWASEIAADCFAFVNTGYAAVATLHDVVDGGDRTVFLYIEDDPHPINYLRVLLGVQMLRKFYGSGPWDDLASSWKDRYPLYEASADTRIIIQLTLPYLDTVADISLLKDMKCFGGVPLSVVADPMKVSPAALKSLERNAGDSLYDSPYWLNREAIRFLALMGYKIAINPEDILKLQKLQDTWMLRLSEYNLAA